MSGLNLNWSWLTSRNSLRKLLDEFSEIIAEAEEHQERRRGDLLILRVKLLLIDSSEVFIREIWKGDDLIAYSYYWIAPNGELLEGWDNAPITRRCARIPTIDTLGARFWTCLITTPTTS